MILISCDQQDEPAAPPKRPVSQRVFGRISKFKHLKGEVILKGRFENLRNLSRTCPAECDFVHANAARVALPLTGPGGKLAVFETRRPGRIADGVTPALVNGTTLMDFCFSPHDPQLVACACDDGVVRIWRIPEEGLPSQVSTPEAQFDAHSDKVQIVKFHPLAKGVLLTAAFDKTVKLWDLEDTSRPMIALEVGWENVHRFGSFFTFLAFLHQGHADQLFSAQFSQCGRFLATLCRDGKIRIYDPRRYENI